MKDDVKISISTDAPPEEPPTEFKPPGEPLAICHCMANVVEAGVGPEDPAYGFVMGFLIQVPVSPVIVCIYEHSVIAVVWNPVHRTWQGGAWSR